MKILFFVHPAFFSDRPQELQWINALAKTLRDRGLLVTLFDSYQDKIRDFDWVVVFSRIDPETLQSLKTSGAKLIVVPGLFGKAPQYKIIQAGGRKAIKALRAVLQRRWPPIEPDSYAHHPFEAVFVISEEWFHFVKKTWETPFKKIERISPEAELSGEKIAQFFSTH